MATAGLRKLRKNRPAPIQPETQNSDGFEKPKATDNCVDANKSIDASVAPPGGSDANRKTEFSATGLPGGCDAGSRKIDQEQRSQSSGSVGTGSVKKKRRPRRAKRRRYKPYHKLTFEEKRELDERETKRAEKFRAERFAHGHAMAPYNTTQFLLEDREARNLEPDVDAVVAESLQHRESRERTFSGTGSFDSEGGTSETGSSAAVSDSFSFERDFEVEYESAKAERLEAMTKDGLVQEYVVMEQDLERSRVESKELRDMVDRLRKENAQLRTKLANSGVLPRPSSAPAPNIVSERGENCSGTPDSAQSVQNATQNKTTV